MQCRERVDIFCYIKDLHKICREKCWKRGLITDFKSETFSRCFWDLHKLRHVILSSFTNFHRFLKICKTWKDGFGTYRTYKVSWLKFWDLYNNERFKLRFLSVFTLYRLKRYFPYHCKFLLVSLFSTKHVCQNCSNIFFIRWKYSWYYKKKQFQLKILIR